MKKVLHIQAYTNSSYSVPNRVKNSLNKNGVYTPYVVAQEGESNPRSLAQGKNVVLNWSRDLIKRIASKFNGIRFFKGHGKETNSHNGRSSVGRAEKVYIDEIDGKLSVVALVPGSFDEDICSMEASVYAGDNGEVTDVQNISAVAIADSREETPAFSGAVALQQIQCFKEIGMRKDKLVYIQCFEDRDDPGSGGGGYDRDRGLRMSFEELRDEVRVKKVWARELYSPEQILEDRELAPKIKERLLEGSVSKEDFEKVVKERDNYLTELTTFRDKDRLKEAGSIIEKTINERQYSEKQKKFFKQWHKEGFFNDIDPADENSVRGAMEKGEKRYVEWRDQGIIEDDQARSVTPGEGDEPIDPTNVDDIADNIDI